MASNAITVAIAICATLHQMYLDLKVQESETKDLIERVSALQTPLKALQDSKRDMSNFVEALQRLVRNLEDCQHLITKTLKDHKLKRFILSGSYVEKYRDVRTSLDSSLLDLQMALQTSEVVNAGEKSVETAKMTVQFLSNADLDRLNETIHRCVHCNEEFRESVNPQNGCKFHTSYPPSYGGYNRYIFDCCGYEISGWDTNKMFNKGCSLGRHSAVHHTRFLYTNYTVCLGNMLKENTEWVNVAQEDFEDEVSKSIAFGRLNQNDVFYLAVYLRGNPCHISTFSSAFFSQEASGIPPIVLGASDVVQLSFMKKIPNRTWEARLDWLPSASKPGIGGVRLSIRTHSATKPNIQEVYFNAAMEKGDVKIIHSDDQVKDITPPVGKVFPMPPKKYKNHIEAPTTIMEDFDVVVPTLQTVCSGEERVPVRVRLNDPVAANPEFSGFNFDNFVCDLMLLNTGREIKGSNESERVRVLDMINGGKMTADEAIRLLGAFASLSTTPPDDNVTIIDAKAFYWKGDKWLPTDKVTLLATTNSRKPQQGPALPTSFPLTIGPKSAIRCIASIPVKSPTKHGSWFGRAHVCRVEPIRLKLEFEEFSGSFVSVEFSFRNPADKTTFPSPDPTDLWSTHCDNLDLWGRKFVKALKPPADAEVGSLFSLCFKETGSSQAFLVTINTLREIAYKAAKEKIKEVKIEKFDNNDVTTYALVDLTLGLVYALRFEIKFGEVFLQDTMPINAKMLAHVVTVKSA